MVEIKDRQIIVDGKPQMMMSGELLYFRIKREDWQDRIDKLKAAGCNTVASYIPWMIHEPVEGQLDVDGHTRPELDVGAFIDLCKQNGLYFVARPGPFVMNELKHEGIPGWIYKKHPHVVPVTWENKKIQSHTLDYLAPDFLAEAKSWYKKIMKVLAPRLHTNGGNIVGVQLDNEIGMLSWVTGSPDLTDQLLDDMTGWLKRRYPVQALQDRYPFDLDDATARNAAIRKPQESYAPQLGQDLGYYMRNRFARYVDELRRSAEAEGIRGVPFIINVHGTGNSRGKDFPIGISQLFECYAQGNEYFAGTDLYLNNLTMDNFHDLYLLNAFMHASALPDQPLTSMEFQCGDGDYGQTFGNRQDPASLDIKTRMCIAQGARLINYYNFAGGYNYIMNPPPNDGSDRISFIGERYGFCDPVSPEGRLNYMYREALARTTNMIKAVAPKLAAMDEEYDPVTFGFIPDYFMTDTAYRASQVMHAIASDLERFRTGDGWDIMARSLLMLNFRFGAKDIQNKPLDPKETPVLVLPSASYMSADLQTKLVDYMRKGGQLFLTGRVPEYDMEGKFCDVLAQALGAKPTGTRDSGFDYYLTASADGWAKSRPDVTTWQAQFYELAPNAQALLRAYDTKEPCAFESKVGKGGAVVMGTTYCADLAFFRTALARMGAKPALQHDCSDQGVFMTSTVNKQGERFLHVMNLDYFEKSVVLTHNGQKLFDGKPILLKNRGSMMLPMNMAFDAAKIVSSTAEVTAANANSIEFRLTQSNDEIVLEGARACLPGKDYSVTKDGNLTRIVSNKNAKIDDKLILNFR